LLLILEPELLHARLRGRAFLPLPFRDLVATDVDELGGEEREHLLENVLEEREDVVADAEDVLGDAPIRLDLVLDAGVAELGVRRDRGASMSGHLDLWDDGDPAVGRVPHDLADIVLCIETAVRHARELALCGIPRERRDHAVLPPGAYLGELRIPLDLDAPALVLGEMP